MDASRYADTICALATPPGLRAALAVVRCSGPRAFELVETVCVTPGGRRFELQGTRRVRLVHVVDAAGVRLDEVLVVHMRGPRSYTGEDVVELHCHGGVLQPGLIVGQLVRAGARQAEPGEFTRRAVIHGRLTLAQAEAINELVDAATVEGVKGLLAARFSDATRHRLDGLRRSLVEVLSVLEGTLDLPEASSELTGPGLAGLEELGRRLASLTPIVARSRLLARGPCVALVGATNAGKSSLFNALVGAPRAIVLPSPGTTRDVVEESVCWGGVVYRLQDTAGRRTANEPAEAEGIRRSREAEERADAVVEVVDAAAPGARRALEAAAAAAGPRRVVAATKVDVLDDVRRREVPEGCVLTSAVSHEGLGELAERLRAAVAVEDGGRAGPPEPLWTARQRDGVERAGACVARALARARRSGLDDVVAQEVREASVELGALVEPIGAEEVLDSVFETFCVGK